VTIEEVMASMAARWGCGVSSLTIIVEGLQGIQANGFGYPPSYRDVQRKRWNRRLADYGEESIGPPALLFCPAAASALNHLVGCEP